MQRYQPYFIPRDCGLMVHHFTMHWIGAREPWTVNYTWDGTSLAKCGKIHGGYIPEFTGTLIIPNELLEVKEQLIKELHDNHDTPNELLQIRVYYDGHFSKIDVMGIIILNPVKSHSSAVCFIATICFNNDGSYTVQDESIVYTTTGGMNPFAKVLDYFIKADCSHLKTNEGFQRFNGLRKLHFVQEEHVDSKLLLAIREHHTIPIDEFNKKYNLTPEVPLSEFEE